MFFGIRRSIILTAFASALLACPATIAIADIIQIPAVAFTQRASSVQPGVANAGTLTTAEGKYYAAVPFPRSGELVCRFSLVHRDNDDTFEVIARLYKKRIRVGDPPFDPPVRMAQVRSGAGSFVTGVTVVNAPSISGNPLGLNTAFYYVELEVTGTLVEILGVQIEYGTVC